MFEQTPGPWVSQMTSEQLYYNYYWMVIQSQTCTQSDAIITTTTNTYEASTKHPTTLFSSSAALDTVPVNTHTNAMDTRENHTMSSNAMPIPRSRIISDFSSELFDIEQSQSSEAILLPDQELSNFSLNHSTPNSSSYGTPSGQATITYGMQPSTSNSNAMWSAIGDVMGLPKEEIYVTGMPKQEQYQMDDDDIFQVDKADLFQGPTLAELNDDTILEDLNIEDYILQDEHSGLISGSHPTLMLLQSHNSMSNSPSMQQMMQVNNQPQQMGQQQQHQSLNQQHQQNLQQQQHDLHAIPINDMIFDMPLHSSSPMFAGYQTFTPTRSIVSRDTLSPQSQTSSTSSNLLNHSVSPPLLGFNNNLTPQHKSQYSTLQELLKKEYSMSPDRLTQLGQSVPGPSTPMSITASNSQDQPYSHRRLQFTQQQASGSRLSSSAPTNSTCMWDVHQQQMWQRREPRQHLLSTGSVAEAESFSSLSTAGILSPEAHDFSHDEGYDDSDSEHYEDYSTDNDSDNEETPRGTGSKKERFFWQYNVQSKGPKGTRLVIKTQVEDPHVLNEVTDPVFSPNCSVRGIKVIKHSGKARKGDGNDLTPNPRKLFSIGKELDKLGRTINDMPPVSELPFNVRPKSRKEKNKLASRACRLKKKAQHEANKIKLYGLETEHKRLVNGIFDIKQSLAIKCTNPNDNAEETNAQIDAVAVSSTQLTIAGISTEFVNQILEKVKSGIPMGGLEDI